MIYTLLDSWQEVWIPLFRIMVSAGELDIVFTQFGSWWHLNMQFTVQTFNNTRSMPSTSPQSHVPISVDLCGPSVCPDFSINKIVSHLASQILATLFHLTVPRCVHKQALAHVSRVDWSGSSHLSFSMFWKPVSIKCRSASLGLERVSLRFPCPNALMQITQMATMTHI